MNGYIFLHEQFTARDSKSLIRKKKAVYPTMNESPMYTRESFLLKKAVYPTMNESPMYTRESFLLKRNIRSGKLKLPVTSE